MKRKDIGVVVLSGFIGAGKTSVLNNLLRHGGDRRMAVILSDMGGVRLDSDVLDRSDAHLFRNGEALIELGSACVGCSLREHLIHAVSRLARDGRYDTIIIELSGVTDPLFVRNAFDLPDKEGRVLSTLARLDHIVTVVDALRFWQDYESGENLLERGVGRGLDDQRALSELLVDQMECGTAIVLNKIDVAVEREICRLEGLLQHLNPDATVLQAVSGNITFDQLERSSSSHGPERTGEPGWMKLLRGHLVPSKEVTGVQAFVYRARRPFHPDRFWTLIQEEWAGVLRSKGYFWIASQSRTCYMWSQAGGSCLYERLGRWWMAIHDRHWPSDP
ncbi:MAG: GTP-binding protein, partial [Nitrospirales bacterium]|nr:GTP-binding protein [Nitrospirales bacterium]